MPASKELGDVIKSFLNICNIQTKTSTYLETGLLFGDSVRFALDLNFKKIISIDINKSSIHNANQRFKNEVENSRVLLVQGDSQEKIKEVYDQSINIFFLDAHDNNIDKATIAPLENEIKFLLNRIDGKQLIIIDDLIKIKYHFLFSHRQDTWKSKLSYKKLKEIIKEIISNKELNTFEIYSNTKEVAYLLLTKNKDFKMDKIFYLKNLINKFFITIRFYYDKKFFTHGLYIILKEYYKKLKT